MECLVKAAKYGRFQSVAHWLEQGADVNGRELRHGYTALHWASWKGYVKIMKLLLKNGADPRITNHRGETSLDAAKLANQNEAHKVLVEELTSSSPPPSSSLSLANVSSAAAMSEESQ